MHKGSSLGMSTELAMTQRKVLIVVSRFSSRAVDSFRDLGLWVHYGVCVLGACLGLELAKLRAMANASFIPQS